MKEENPGEATYAITDQAPPLLYNETTFTSGGKTYKIQPFVLDPNFHTPGWGERRLKELGLPVKSEYTTNQE